MNIVDLSGAFVTSEPGGAWGTCPSRATLQGCPEPRGPKLVGGGGLLVAVHQLLEWRQQWAMGIQERPPLRQVRRELCP
jgi:hypothetical protein